MLAPPPLGDQNVTTKIKRNVLNRRDEFRLADWLRSKGPDALGLLTLPAATAQAAKDLNIAISEGNVRRLTDDLALNVKFKNCHRRSGHAGLRGRVAKLEALVAHLYGKLGEAVPDDAALAAAAGSNGA